MLSKLTQSVIIHSLCLALLLPHTLIAQSGKGSNEYFTTNPKGRLLIKLQVWGDVSAPGIYNVPDTTTLVELMGHLGGPQGSLGDVKVIIRRLVEEDGSFRRQIAEFSGEDLLTSDEAASVILKQDDIIYVESGMTFMEGMSVVNGVTGVINSVLLLYLSFRTNF